MNTMIIAACNNEDTSWLKDVPDSWTKYLDVTFCPLGREAFVYLDWLVNHEADGDVVFCQGNPFAHDPMFMAHLADPIVRYYGQVHECDPRGIPACDWTPMHAWSEVLSLVKRDTYKFVAGAQYRLTPDQIRNRNESFYRALLELTKIPGNRSAWVCERLWPIIFGIEL